MIVRFGNKLAEDLFNGDDTKATRSFPSALRRVAQRKLQYINAAKTLADLRVPPGNRLESLKGDSKGCFSIRINDQWRIVFTWDGADANDVSVIDYH